MTEVEDGAEDVDRYFDVRFEAKDRNKEYSEYLHNLLGGKNHLEAVTDGLKLRIGRFDPQSSAATSGYVEVRFDDDMGNERYWISPTGLEYFYVTPDVVSRMGIKFDFGETWAYHLTSHYDGFGLYQRGGAELAGKFHDLAKAVVTRVKEIVEGGGQVVNDSGA